MPRGAPPARPASARLNVLLLADDPDQLTINTANLRRGFDQHGRHAGFTGMAIDAAETLPGAIEMVHTQRYDILVVSLGLREVEGIAGALDPLREAAPLVPIVVVMAEEAVGNAIASVMAGADAFLPKGEVTPERMIRVVLATLVAKRLQ